MNRIEWIYMRGKHKEKFWKRKYGIVKMSANDLIWRFKLLLTIIKIILNHLPCSLSIVSIIKDEPLINSRWKCSVGISNHLSFY